MFKYIDTDTFAFYGYPVPSNVQFVDWEDNTSTAGKTIIWQVYGSNERHAINFPHATEENILAVLAAMRLS
jgi:hypothetical protein